MRNIARDLENRVTAEMRRRVADFVLPILVSETHRLRTGCHPLYEFMTDQGGKLCLLTLVQRFH